MKQKKFEDFISVEDKVKFLLENNPDTKDNDYKLLSIYWLNEVKDGLADLSAYEFIMKIFKGQVTAPATIIRTRQIVQKKNEYLRGAIYKNKREVVHNYFRKNKI